jgi:hypothetical protein
MKKNCWSSIPFLLLMFAGCGDAGIGFNITRNVPIIFKVVVPGNDPGVEINPPAFTQTFRLSDVSTFQDALSDLAESDAVTVNSVTYAITDVSTEEEVELDEISLSVASEVTQQRSVLAITGKLQNTSERSAGVNDSDTGTIEQILTTYKEVDNTLTFDFAEAPASDLDFTFTLYYNITLRVRY